MLGSERRQGEKKERKRERERERDRERERERERERLCWVVRGVNGKGKKKRDR